MRRSLVVLAVALASSGCGADAAPVRVTAPSAAPSATLRRGTAPVCLAGGGTGEGRNRGLVTVGPRPTGVVAVWLPGMNQRPCRAVMTRGNAATARRLAGDVARAPRFPSGAFNCPADFGTVARLYFIHARSGKADLVEVMLSGCRGVGAPGRKSRTLTDRLSRDLATIAPAPWRGGLTR